jgi:hypothetical protein
LKHFERVKEGLWVNHKLWGWLLIKPTTVDGFWQGFKVPDSVHPLLRMPSKATEVATWFLSIPKMTLPALEKALDWAYAKKLRDNAVDASIRAKS